MGYHVLAAVNTAVFRPVSIEDPASISCMWGWVGAYESQEPGLVAVLLPAEPSPQLLLLFSHSGTETWENRVLTVHKK